MKVLTIFIDMIRPNRLSSFNEEIHNTTPLDDAFRELGGTCYKNCFTPAPDTPRAIATFLTGMDAYENGCDTRLKWPQYFLKKELKTVFDLFLEKKYKVDIFSSPQERENGLFPEHILNMNIHNKDLNMDQYLSELELEDDHCVFISIPDYHWAFDDFGYSTRGEKLSYREVKKAFDIVFNNLNKDDFDHIFIFSDHGFKFAAEWKVEPKSYLLNEDRTNVLMIHRSKGQNSQVMNDKLCSIADFYATYEDILGDDRRSGISLLSEDERNYVIAEDHINFTPEINQNIELWALITKDYVYIRELSKATLIERQTRNMKSEIVTEYDAILASNSSFGVYIDEYQKIFAYERNIFAKTYYVGGAKRMETTKLSRYYFMLLDGMKKACGYRL